MAAIYRTDWSARVAVEQEFPNLQNVQWRLRSPMDRGYNCFAWAACDNTQRWEPSPDWYWPISNRAYSVDCFIEGFATLGYKACDDPIYEFGFQKIAVYAVPLFMGVRNFPTHMARQHVFGRGWLSKLGDLEDITHPTLEGLSNDLYGRPVQYLRRSWWAALTRSRTFHCAWETFKYWRHRSAHPLGG